MSDDVKTLDLGLRGRGGTRPIPGHRVPSDPPPEVNDREAQRLAALGHPAGCRCPMHFTDDQDPSDGGHATVRMPKPATRPYEVPKIISDDEARAVAADVLERGPRRVDDDDLRRLARHVVDRIPAAE